MPEHRGATMDGLYAFLAGGFFGLPLSWADAIGFATGVICLWLLSTGHVANFAFGIVSMACYGFTMWVSDLYANFLLALVFIGLNAYGWLRWARRRADPSDPGIIHTPRRWRLPLVAAGILLAGVLFLVLRDRSASPELDALTTSLSLVAQFMVAMKFVENWWLWLVADVFYVGLFLQQRLWAWLVLYLVYMALAYRGIRAWQRAAGSGLERLSP